MIMWLAAYRKTLQDFQPDMVFAQMFSPGKALEYLNPNTMRWPGFGVDPYCGHQAIEVDSMKDDEYDFFMNKPADFLMRYHLPRTHKNLEGLSMFPELSDIGWFEPWSGQKLALLLTEPKIEEAIKNLQNAGRKFRKWQPKMIDVIGKDGGFILAPRSSTDEVKPENLKTMIEFTKEYGRY